MSFEREPPILLAQPCSEPSSAPNSDISVCLASLCTGHTDLGLAAEASSLAQPCAVGPEGLGGSGGRRAEGQRKPFGSLHGHSFPRQESRTMLPWGPHHPRQASTAWGPSAVEAEAPCSQHGITVLFPGSLCLEHPPTSAFITPPPALRSFWSSTDASLQAHRKYRLSQRESQENASFLLMRLGLREHLPS